MKNDEGRLAFIHSLTEKSLKNSSLDVKYSGCGVQWVKFSNSLPYFIKSDQTNSMGGGVSLTAEICVDARGGGAWCKMKPQTGLPGLPDICKILFIQTDKRHRAVKPTETTRHACPEWDY